MDLVVDASCSDVHVAAVEFHYKWDVRFLNLAKEISTWSKDPSTKVGAVVVGDERRVLITGYNGFPRGYPDDLARYLDKDEKYDNIVHAEKNCVYTAALNGVSLKGTTLYVDGLCVCQDCAQAVVQSKISRVVMRTKMPMPEKWRLSWDKTKQMFEYGRVKWVIYDPGIDGRNESVGPTVDEGVDDVPSLGGMGTGARASDVLFHQHHPRARAG